ncbi:ATP-binding protein [Reichenbachiella carrageenanivorans]|uniref:ATP-binding protein n=1 Tax=Reichenbachiella carrageenanivorans TaxID=2979869 RepID=A0ABY6CUX0_9BACT|nr:ATP-binding protein [Reichenbachiella carrageenanivorans]UXX77721.1 ATP-binding protein [Reichenbachiella carrageenanivorans]
MLVNSTLSLESDINWVRQGISLRVDQFFNQKEFKNELFEMAPKVENSDVYAKLLFEYNLTLGERFVLVLSLMPSLFPGALDKLRVTNPDTGQVYSEFGGAYVGAGVLVPTVETAIFLLAGSNISHRMEVQDLLGRSGRLVKHNLVCLDEVVQGMPPMSATLYPTNECLHKIFRGEDYHPNYSSSFPAQRLETGLDWEDLVLSYDTFDALQELDAWLMHHQEMQALHEVSKKFKRGYRALFYGPSGTGKTLTASLLGKKYGREVYHVDLAMMVSKFIGETEKNLKNIFDTAENKDWILFFDEADALFGKRTQASSSNDRHANQEVSYLLQRIEDYPGLIILASNLKSNMDQAFQRRFQSMVYFPIPSEYERQALWEKAFSAYLTLDDEVDLRHIAKRHELTGGAISNVLRYCTLMALKRNAKNVQADELDEGIRRELKKDGKTM